jgi:hypothetical protein
MKLVILVPLFLFVFAPTTHTIDVFGLEAMFLNNRILYSVLTTESCVGVYSCTGVYEKLSKTKDVNMVGFSTDSGPKINVGLFVLFLIELVTLTYSLYRYERVVFQAWVVFVVTRLVSFSLMRQVRNVYLAANMTTTIFVLLELLSTCYWKRRD